MSIKYNPFHALSLFVVCMTHLFANIASADTSPWYTGPIIAGSAQVVPNGHTDFELYTLLVRSTGVYNSQSKWVSSSTSKSNQTMGVFSHGLTDNIDMQFVVPYAINQFRGQEHRDPGDMQAGLGFQVMTQPQGSWWPSLRMVLKESFPSGRYDGLTAGLLQTDDHGTGSYLTTLGFNFQTLYHFLPDHDLRTRLVLNITKPAPVSVMGISHYGGTSATYGTFYPGATESVDLAGELSLTQRWVLVMEGFYIKGSASPFHGHPGLIRHGRPTSLRIPSNDEFSLAPAFEYNFSANYGLIAGVWYSVSGKNVSQFGAPVIALNAYW